MSLRHVLRVGGLGAGALAGSLGVGSFLHVRDKEEAAASQALRVAEATRLREGARAAAVAHAATVHDLSAAAAARAAELEVAEAGVHEAEAALAGALGKWEAGLRDLRAAHDALADARAAALAHGEAVERHETLVEHLSRDAALAAASARAAREAFPIPRFH